MAGSETVFDTAAGGFLPEKESEMTAQSGKDVLLKIDEAASGSFVTVAGLRTNRISLNAEAVDVTTADSAGQWRELLAGAGLRTASVAGAGIFTDAATDASIRQVFFDRATPPFQVVIPEFGVLEGPFQVTSLEYAGTHDGEATYEIALASAGALVFTAF